MTGKSAHEKEGDNEEEEKEEAVSHDDSQINSWTRHFNLFILVFLAGIFTASFTAFSISAYFNGFVSISQNQNDFENSLLPDPAHLQVVDESRYFTTDLQKFKLINEEPSQAQDQASEAEALKNMEAALLFKKKGQFEKAMKLVKHALALSPKQPKILNFYGEFVMEVEDDAVEADHAFVKALTFSDQGSSENARALQNRQKTAMLVEELDLRMLKAIDEKKKAFLRINRSSGSLKRAKKEAYFQHIYHTVGIEGNTLNLAQTRTLLETRLAVGGKSIQEHNEVLGLDAALKYINQTLVDRALGHITMRDILEIHKRVIGYVDPLEAGFFRQTQVFVGDYIPPHPSHIDVLMNRFLTWLNDPATLMLHPVRMAAMAHYKLVYIHPFTDGNGRTSRLLMNWILMQNGFPPVIIRKQDRLSYYRHLETANDGDIRPFVRFIGRCAARTLDAYIWSTKENSLAPFGDDSENVISPKDAIDHLNYHDAIISGGSLGPNITITP